MPPALSQLFQSIAEVRVDSGDEAVFSNAIIYCSTALDSVNKDLINRFPESLGLIANIGVGLDKIDLDAARSRGITVSNTPVVTEDTADLTWALILAASSLGRGSYRGRMCSVRTRFGPRCRSNRRWRMLLKLRASSFVCPE